jgi:3-oxoacyl-ACP reductase-like protein
MFSNLMGRIFGKSEEAAPTPAPEPAAVEAPAEVAATEAAPDEAAVTEAAPAAEAAPVAVSAVDIEANLAAMAKENSEDLDWKRSIVDLLKLVGMDSSFGARKELALELGYSQADIDSKGSAEMNMWLHKQVMKKLAENGGTVPADLLD